jgi:tetratricopeptide (TPR) repeat protein
VTVAVTRRRRDHRPFGLLLTAALVVAGGAWLQHAPEPPSQPVGPAVDRALQDRFDAAVVLLQAGRHEEARAAFVRVIEQAPRLPEAHVDLGYALLGLQRAAPARQAFETAIGLRPMQANAYHGLALAHEALGDLDLAIGAMRTYVHLAPHGDAVHVRRAQAALWEWEARRAAQRVAPFPDPGTDSRSRHER